MVVNEVSEVFTSLRELGDQLPGSRLLVPNRFHLEHAHLVLQMSKCNKLRMLYESRTDVYLYCVAMPQHQIQQASSYTLFFF